jgi:hypothetical protein
MDSTISSGCDRNGTWRELISVVVTPIRLAQKRSSSGFTV